jgi:hypothetical protein
MDIKEVVKAFNEMEVGGLFTCYAIGGAVGALFYLEPTDTFDVDIFISLSPAPGRLLIDISPVTDYLIKKGGIREKEHVRIFGWPVQILAASEGLLEEALKEALDKDIEGTFTRVFSAEHLAAIALKTGRAKDKARLLQFLEADALDRKKFHDIIDRYGLKEAWKRFESQFLNDRP